MFLLLIAMGASLPAVAMAGSAPNADPDEQTKAVIRAYRATGDDEDARTADEIEARLRREAREYSTAIAFYGLVLDNRGAPVPAATVTYSSTNGSFDGERQTQSSATGSFMISGIRGKYLDVRVSHEGYYTLNDSKNFYYYAGRENPALHVPDAAQPEVFRLHKKGEATELIHQADQILFNRDETDRSFSLYDHTRRRDQPEYVIIRPVDRGRVNSHGKRVLDLELAVPQGGIQLRKDAFQFIAPTEGYQSSLIAPPNVGVDLIDFFVRFENGNYGRFTIAGGGGQYDVDSYLNPDRSPNLEYDREKAITFVQTGKMGIDLLYPASDDPNKPLPNTPQPVQPERQRKTLYELRREAMPPPPPPRN